VGFVGQQDFGIGDTVTEEEGIVYTEIPHFPPEVFAFLNNPNPSKFKKFREGLDQLLQEGVVQGLQRTNAAQRVPILAAVGPLQFEVVQYRLESEYGAESRIEPTDWKILRWLDPSLKQEDLNENILPTGATFVQNAERQLAILFTGEWGLNYFIEKNPAIKLAEMPFRDGYT
jgi:peptide chain release factor 3